MTVLLVLAVIVLVFGACLLNKARRLNQESLAILERAERIRKARDRIDWWGDDVPK